MNVATTISKTKAEQDVADHFANVRVTLPGDAKIAALRDAAIADFERFGLPHRRIEEWKYTDLRARFVDFPAPISGRDEADAGIELTDLALPLASLDAYRLVFVDGVLSDDLSTLPQIAGIEIRSFSEMAAEGPDWFTAMIGTINPPEKDDAVVQLNAAFMTDGAVIRVENGTIIEKPIHLISVLSAAKPGSVALRNVAIFGDRSQATLVESFVSIGDAAQYCNGVSEISLGAGAVLDHIKVQSESANVTHLSTWMTRIGAEAKYRAFQFTTGAALSRNQIFVRFDGEHASANVSGAAMLRGKQHCDTTLIVDYAVPHCDSRELFKLVLDDEARGVFQGKLVVRQGAQKSDGLQMAHALLLSETAEFDSKPELEIFADDVVCGHGSTSGQIDEDMLFYLRSRGISEDEARGLLIAAFIGEALELIENEDIREALMGTVFNWFGDVSA